MVGGRWWRGSSLFGWVDLVLVGGTTIQLLPHHHVLRRVLAGMGIEERSGAVRLVRLTDGFVLLPAPKAER